MNITRRSEFARFFTSLTIIITAIIITDISVGYFCRYLYNKQRSGLLYRTSFSIDSTNAKYIVVGSSKANHQYNPQVFENQLKSTFYNCGRDGQSAMYYFAVTSAIINRYTPKLIIIDFRPNDFSTDDEDQLSVLLPYYKNPVIRPYLDYADKWQTLKLFSQTYPFNSILLNMIIGLKPKYELDYKGYTQLNQVNHKSGLDTLKENKTVNNNKVKEFFKLLNSLKKRNIKTLLIISPIHFICEDPVTVGVCDSARKKYNNVRFLNFTNVKHWQKNTLFSDDNHLNGNGSTLFSAVIANYIKHGYALF